MKIKLTIYNENGTEEVFISKEGECNSYCGGMTGIGYMLELPDSSRIIVHPTLHRRIKVEELN